MKLMQIINKFFKNGDLRTQLAKKNIFFSLIIKGVSLIIYLLIVPLTLNYLKAEEYGLWLTLSSVLMWINYFDIGLGQGLRNKLTEALAVEDYKLGQKYISTTLALLVILMSLIFIIFVIINPFLDWGSILNTEPTMAMQISEIIIILFAFVCLQLVFRIFSIVLISDQKPALNNLIVLAGNALSLLIILILTKTTPGSLINVAISFSAAPVVVMIATLPVFFWGKYSIVRPKISAIDFKYSKQLMGVGIQFFIIQVAMCIVVYASTNIIITQLFNGTQVTIYNIAYKYLYTVSMVYLIIIMPFWSASTEAYVKRDFVWINTAVKKLLKIWALSVIFTIVLVIFSSQFYLLWVGSSVKVPFSLTICVAIYVILFNWSNTFIYIINGIGKIRIQLYATVFISIIYIPIAVFFGKIWGVNGVILATCVSLIPTSILMPIQFYKLLSDKATGLWKK